MNKWTGFIFLLGALLLAGLFFALRPAPQPDTLAAPLPAQTFAFTVEGGHLVGGPATVPLTQGTPITLRFLASGKDEVHLHGYDLKVKLEPSEPADIHFLADKSGRFEVELHKSHATLFALEVRPRHDRIN
ncbi:hypothetical protein FHR99_002764 [Litorivivens lipolytica]|uniref:EfeO-type cupredoxin-like domain-containing protein n=1 Tax=Litorivivens lipolytica TaxID=1524264 RepID=A0A7W4W6U7_9GAMM|nr:hypothetical protein [Litorivivens lipolytica]MBB3048490.1 hypothetical protein [Litorivivens lipolytica]